MSEVSFLPPGDHPYLDEEARHLDVAAIRAQRAQLIKRALATESLKPLFTAWQPFPAFRTSTRCYHEDVVSIGDPEELSPGQREQLLHALHAFRPWKKGPFRIFGIDIDAEWQSQQKWQRLAPVLAQVKGKRVADIGCHNGYYMYKLLPFEPKLVIGFEPFPKLWFNFHVLQQFAQEPRLAFELLGMDAMRLYPEFFDVVLCLGILYHHPDPVGQLRIIHGSMVAGAKLIIDCQGIPGEDSIALMPAGRYAGAKGTWWLPTLACIKSWLKRSQFRKVRLLYAGKLSCEEQRSTPWAPIKSLGDFLTADQETTVEGYPAPWRFYLEATK